MAQINQIIERFPEVIYQNSIDAKIINGEVKVYANKEEIVKLIPQIKNNLAEYFENPDSTLLVFKRNFEDVISKAQSLQRREKSMLISEFKKPICVFLQEISGSSLLLSNGTSNLRIQINDGTGLNFLKSQTKHNPFYNLIWINRFHKEILNLIYVECQLGQFFPENLEIGFGDDIIINSKSKNIKQIADDFYEEYVYRSFDRDILIVKRYSNSSEKHFTLCGINSEADIKVVEQRWLIQRVFSKKALTKNSQLFKGYSVAVHPQIIFVESSKAAEAMAALKEDDVKGSTLISLWKKYSEIELNRANKLHELIGDLSFTKENFQTESVCRIKLKSINENIKNSISENIDDLTNTSIQILTETEDNNKSNRFKIKSINKDFSFDIYDENNMLPEKGTFNISIVGDEIVAKRRERALLEINENARYLSKLLICLAHAICISP